MSARTPSPKSSCFRYPMESWVSWSRGKGTGAGSSARARASSPRHAFFSPTVRREGNARGRATALARREGSGSGSEEYPSSGTLPSPAKMELYTVSTSATRAHAWTMAHTAVSGEAFAFGSASFAPTPSRWMPLRPKRARTFLVAFFTTNTPPAIVSGVRVATCGACALGRAGRDDEYTKATRCFGQHPWVSSFSDWGPYEIELVTFRLRSDPGCRFRARDAAPRATCPSRISRRSTSARSPLRSGARSRRTIRVSFEMATSNGPHPLAAALKHWARRSS